MSTLNYSNFLDILNFERSSGGTALTKVSYGSELITNGTFNSDLSGWTDNSTGTGFFVWNQGSAEIGGGPVSSGRGAAYQQITLVEGQKYQLSLRVGGYGSIRVGPNIDSGDMLNELFNSPYFSSSGIDSFYKVFEFIATSTTAYVSLAIQNTSASGYYDNISLKSIDLNNSGELILYNHNNNIPRLEYDKNSNLLGLLLETQRTNLILNSIHIGSGIGTSISINSTDAPDGSLNATLIESTSSGIVRSGISSSNLTSTGVPYVLSFFVKNIDANYIQILNSGDSNYFMYFNLLTLDTGSSGSATTGYIEDYGNGWYRCNVLFDGSGNISNIFYLYFMDSDSGGYSGSTVNSGKKLYVWGTQLEVGTFVSSYIPTSGSTVTRALDNASVPIERIGYNKEVGTILIEVINNAPDNQGGTGNNTNRLIQLTGGNLNYSSLGIGSTSSRVNRPDLSSRSNATAIYSAGDLFSLENTFDKGNVVKFAGLFDPKNGRIAGSVNGSDVFERTGAVVAGIELPFTELQLGIGQGSAHFKNVSYYPYRLTDRQLKQITGATYNFDYTTIEAGTITRSPVATGAELVGYSGFSSTNYLEQPYNPDLDFGTGDFSIMGWIKKASSNSRYAFQSESVDGTGEISLLSTINNDLAFIASDVTSSLVFIASSAANVIDPNAWHFFVARRFGIVGELYLDGTLVATDSNASGDITNVDLTRVTRFGARGDLASFWDGSLALFRISATAPTAEQIKKIYEDEKKLFQENAKCTLYGTSDSVTALAYDDKTNLLHVGTSSGRSVFDGLQRVDNTTTPVTTAISAVNGIIVEQ